VSPVVILVTDPVATIARTIDVIEEASAAIGPGRLAVQLRHKEASPAGLEDAAARLRDVTRRAGALLVVNAFTPDRLALAARIAADGVHVPCDAVALAGALAAHAFVSTPAHTDHEVDVAARAGPHAVLVSPIWSTPNKGAPRGLEALRAARARAHAELRVYALGGVDGSRAAACKEAGADGVAVIRALLDARDVAAEASRLAEPFGGV
jgi:thiamine-phosphate pyrophosphorylase